MRRAGHGPGLACRRSWTCARAGRWTSGFTRRVGAQRGGGGAHDRRARPRRAWPDRRWRCLLALLAPSLTIAAGVALALASICLIPAGFGRWHGAAARRRTHPLERADRGDDGAARDDNALGRARRDRGLAVYGGIAIGGARRDLLAGIERATDQYFATAQLWVTSGKDVFNTNAFAPGGPAAAIARAPGVASVRVYRGGLLDVGERRMWVRAKPAADETLLESSQLVHGEYAMPRA